MGERLFYRLRRDLKKKPRRVPRPLNGEKIVFSTTGAGKLDTTCKRTKLDPYLTSCMKINSK